MKPLPTIVHGIWFWVARFHLGVSCALAIDRNVPLAAEGISLPQRGFPDAVWIILSLGFPASSSWRLKGPDAAVDFFTNTHPDTRSASTTSSFFTFLIFYFKVPQRARAAKGGDRWVRSRSLERADFCSTFQRSYSSHSRMLFGGEKKGRRSIWNGTSSCAPRKQLPMTKGTT